MGFEIIFITTLMFMLYTRYTDKEAMRVQLDSVAKFLAFMAMVTCIRIAKYDFLMDIGIQPPGLPPELLQMGLWQLVLVFWEDAFYVLPIYWLFKYEKGFNLNIKYWGLAKKKLGKIAMPTIVKKMKTVLVQPATLLLALGLSMNFALGHAYQGLVGVVITFFYPFFISFRYGKKHGFGTIMCAHILYDFITYFTVKLMPLFLS